MGSYNFKQPVYCARCAQIVRVVVPETGAEVVCPNCAEIIRVTSGEDVFISYSSADSELAQALADQLHELGIRFWLAPHMIDLGEKFPERISEAIDQASIVVALLTNDAIESPWVESEITLAIGAKKKMIPVLIDDVKLPNRWGLITVNAQHITTRRDAIGSAIRSLARSIASSLAPELAKGAEPKVSRPFRTTIEACGVDQRRRLFVGPQQYTRAYRDAFHGREIEISEIIKRLHDERIMTIVAPSGAGKSSLLAAGIEPALIASGWDVISGARVGHPPDPELRFPFSSVRNVFTFSSMRGVSERVIGIEELRNGRSTTWTISECLGRCFGDDGSPKLLILDQFEEIFTQYRDRHEHREDFVTQLEQALEDHPSLTVLIAMRQEYVVDLKHLMETVSESFRPKRFELRRLTNETLERVISDIAAPQARFADGVARRIIGELNTIHVLDDEGSPVTKAGEFIELVHLQIVCQHLWETLDQGQLLIEHRDLDRAAERFGQQKFEMFVRGALNQFYANTVAAVASDRGNTEPRIGDDIGLPQPEDAIGRYPEELIRLGCRAFVTREHTRRQIHEESGYVGRLPSWVVKLLADRYLLRLDTAGSVRYYELSHDLLAPIVASQSDPRSENLLYGAELIKKRLDSIKQRGDSPFTDWFDEADELLAQCDVYLDAPGYLLKDESELLLRASIRTGTDLGRWSKRVHEDRPELFERILGEAINADDEMIRLHVIRMLSASDGDAHRLKLLDLLVADPSPNVRFESALAILRVDDEALFDELMRRFRAQDSDQNLTRSIALLLALSDEMEVSEFHRVYEALRGSKRRKIRSLAWAIRFREAMKVLPSILIVTSAFAGLVAASYKWIPGIFNWALVQKSPGAFMGIFHGLIAGTIWGGGISVGLAVHRLVVFRVRQSTGVVRPLGSMAFGALAGALSSALVVLVITNTYEPDSLTAMGWIGSVKEGAANEVLIPTRPSADFYADLFLRTRMGWAHMILGTFLGISIAAVTNSVRASNAWESFLEEQSAFEGVAQIARATTKIVPLVLRHLWPALLVQTIAGLIALPLLRPGPLAEGLNTKPIFGIIGDASTQVVGTLGAVVGLGVVTIIIRHGLVIKARSKAR